MTASASVSDRALTHTAASASASACSATARAGVSMCRATTAVASKNVAHPRTSRERAVEADAAPHGDRRGRAAAGVVATRRHERAGGDEGVDRHLGRAVLDRPEDRRRAAADGDDESLAAGGAPQLRRQVLAQLPGADSLTGPCVRECTHGELTGGDAAGNDRRHELRLHRRTGRAAQDRAVLPRGQEPGERRARADGDRARLRRGGVVADGRADGAAGPAHPRGVRRLGVQLRRARHRPRGDGPRPAVRAVLLHGRARRQHAAPVRRRGGQEGLPPRHRQRRDDRHRRVHRAVGQVGRVGHRDGGDGVRRRLHADRHEDVRARRPRRRPDPRRRPHRRRASACSPSTATPTGSPARRCRRWTRPASRPGWSSRTRRPG